MYVGSLAGVRYLRYTVLTTPKKGETAVHCCDPALAVLVMLVSRKRFSHNQPCSLSLVNFSLIVSVKKENIDQGL